MFRGLSRQFGAAFDAAAFQDGAASLAGDPGAETVRAGAVTRVWLVSSFWHIFGIVPFLKGFYKLYPLLFDFLYFIYRNIIHISALLFHISKGVDQKSGKLIPLTCLRLFYHCYGCGKLSRAL